MLLAIAITVALVAGALHLLDRASDGGPDTGPGELAAATDLRNGRSFLQDNLWSDGETEYAAWVTPDGEPLVGARTGGGSWRSRSLAALPGNPLAAPFRDDEHNVLTLGVDHEGYIHVAGNVHGDPLRYVRSVRPGDISSWQPAEVAGPAAAVTYPSFVGLPDGTLQLWRREGASGDGVAVLDVLDPGAEAWRTLGTVVDGTASNESPYLHHVTVDPTRGTIHLVIEWRGTDEPATTNDVSYARSADGGRTWTSADGDPLLVPLTHRSAELVIDTDEGAGLRNGGGLAVDAEGHPHAAVLFEPEGGGRIVTHLWHDGLAWRQEHLRNPPTAGRPAVAVTGDGAVWLVGAIDGRLAAQEITPDGDDRRRSGRPVPAGWEATYDSQALGRDGRIRSLVPHDAVPAVDDLGG